MSQINIVRTEIKSIENNPNEISLIYDIVDVKEQVELIKQQMKDVDEIEIIIPRASLTFWDIPVRLIVE